MPRNLDIVKRFPVKQIFGLLLLMLVFLVSMARVTGVDLLTPAEKSRAPLSIYQADPPQQKNAALRSVSSYAPVQQAITDESISSSNNSLGLDMVNVPDNTLNSDVKEPSEMNVPDNTLNSDVKEPSERILVKGGFMSLLTPTTEKGQAEPEKQFSIIETAQMAASAALFLVVYLGVYLVVYITGMATLAAILFLMAIALCRVCGAAIPIHAK
jgi:hypothetical protein